MCYFCSIINISKNISFPAAMPFAGEPVFYWLTMLSGWIVILAVIILYFIYNPVTRIRLLQKDVAKKQFKINKLSQELELMSLLASETDNMVAVTDPDVRVIYANRSFRYTLGLKPEKKLIGRKLFEIEGFDKIYDIFLDSTERRQNAQTELFLTNAQGQRYWLQISFSHAMSENEHRVVVIATNINDLKYAEEEISQQREELMVQSEQLESMNTELEHANQLTTDSINYAQRIQYAILPRREDYTRYLQDSFVMFRPRDIVSGDFYWYGEADEQAFFVEADCTGHGVPGALMATIGNTLLNEIVISEKIYNPAIVLKELDRKVKSVLRQEAGLPEQQDGMDMTIVQYNFQNRELSVSLANQFAYFKQQDQLYEIEGSLFAIGGSDLSDLKPDFDLHRYKVNPGDVLYLFSDGYRDQFNEDEAEKMMRPRFKAIIEKVADLDMNEQKNMLEEHFDQWRSNTRQIDDVLVWGLRF